VIRIALAAAAAAGLALAAVAGSDAGGRPLRVAILVPKGGPFAPHNVLIANGAQIAADESGNASGPVGNTKIVLEQVPLAVDASPVEVMNDLVSHGTDVVVLPCNVDSVPSLARAGARAGLLMLLPCDPDPKAIESIPRVWPTAMAGNAEAAQIVNYAHTENAINGYILSSRGSDYVASLDRYFLAAAKLSGVKILGRSDVALSGKNVATVAAAIKKAKPRAIFTALYSPYAESIIAGLRRHGVLNTVYGTDGMDADGHYSSYGGLLDDVNIGSFGYPRPASSRFVDDYRAAFGHDPAGSFPGLGYEAIRILEAAVAHAGSTRPAALDAAFAKGFSVTGVALADVTYPGKGARIPFTDAGLARIVRGRHVALFASNPADVIRIPAP
jgi:ABC-type branched-subunit amino acid transport system substrate-binding protein